MKIVKTIQLKIVILTAMKYRCILHGNVCVMTGTFADVDAFCCVKCVNKMK